MESSGLLHHDPDELKICKAHLVRVIFDTNVYDALVDDPTLRAAVTTAITAGQLQLLTTHIQRDEIAAIADESRRAGLSTLLLVAESVATGGFVLGTSRLGEARLMSDEDAAEFDTTMRNGAADARGTNDALIISTARFEDAVLISQDRRCRNRAKRAGVTAKSKEWLAEALSAE